MIKIGVIGSGYWGPNIIRNFQSLKNCRVKTVADLIPENLAKIKKLYPDIITTRNHQDILKDRQIEAVSIVTPSITHYSLARESLAAGKHVLSEKPMTLNSEEAENLIKIAERGKKVLMVGNTFEYSSPIRRAREILKRGDLGKPYLFYLKRISLGPIHPDAGVIWDFAYHDISILTYWLGGNPLKVSARGKSFLQKGVSDFGFIDMEFPRNIFAHIRVGWLYPQKERGGVIIGSRKMLAYDDLNQERPLAVYNNPGLNWRAPVKISYPRINIQEPLKVECRHFIDCVRKSKTSLTGGKRGLEIIKILEGVQKSINLNGETVNVSK